MKIKKWTSSTRKRFKLNISRFSNEYGDCSLTKGGVDMATLTNNVDTMLVLNGDHLDDFLKQTKCQSDRSKKFWDRCAEVSKIIKKRK